ncbi:MAG: secretin and TonB N-terminal domain-containing protein, partial [Bacteroidota bacterium]
MILPNRVRQALHSMQALKILKLITVLLAATFLQVSAKGLSQTVSISGRKITLKKIFTAIESQTSYVFFYDAALVRGKKPVDIDMKNVPVETVLRQCLNGQSLDFSIQNNTIVITTSAPAIAKPAVVSAPVPPTAIDIRSRVVNEKDEPVEGVSVKVKGTTRGTTTDNNGGFSIDADPG